MNTTNCPEGLARDNIYSSQEQALCEIPTTGYFILFGIGTFLRVVITLIIIALAIVVRRKRNENESSSSSRNRLPLTSMIEVVHCIIIVGFFGLYATYPNIFNGETGLGPLGVVFQAGSAQVAFLLSILKIIHLGKRVLPRSLRGTTNDDQGLSSIAADKILSVFFYSAIFSQVLAFVVSIVSFSLTGDELKTQRDILASTATFLTGLVQVLAGFVLIRQTLRITKYIDQVFLGVESVVTDKSESRKNMRIAKKRMINRLYGIGLVFLHSVLYFYATFTGRFPWYFYFISWFVNISSVSLTLVAPISAYLVGKNHSSKSSSPTTTSPNKSLRVAAESTATRMNALGTATFAEESSFKAGSHVSMNLSSFQVRPAEE